MRQNTRASALYSFRPTLPGVVRRPFASVSDHDDVDFNEVFFTDARVPAENLVGELNGGWRVATGSLGHERAMLWMDYADMLHALTVDFGPSGSLQRDHYATLVMDSHALRLLGSAALAQGRSRRRGCACAVGAQAARLGGNATRL